MIGQHEGIYQDRGTSVFPRDLDDGLYLPASHRDQTGPVRETPLIPGSMSLLLKGLSEDPEVIVQGVAA